MTRPSGLRRAKKAIAVALLAGTPAIPATAQLYRDPSRSVEERTADLVSLLTLEEKAAQMQDSAPAIPRLGIPAYNYWNEALHGVARAGEATVFPQAIGMAATWDKALLRAEGEVIAIEGRAKFNQAQHEGNTGRYFGLTFWSPNINIFRDPRWGRGQETLGEDPYLTGVLATEFIRGIQGNHPRYLTAAATAKHLAVHSGPEPLRHHFNVNPSPQDLAETYLPAFRRTVVDGKVEIVMCAYNALDGKPACASPELLRGILRGQWGFAGHVTSDCGAIDDITTGHKFTKTNVEATAVAVKAGTDMNCGFKNEYLDLPKAVAAGLITESEVDTALKRIFATRIRLGLFDPPDRVPFNAIAYSANHSLGNRALALRAARESIVLLKNDGILPLAPGRKVAVIGPTAASLIALEGNYNGTPTDPVLPVDGMIAAYGADRVAYAQGSPFVAELPLPVPRTALGGGVTGTFYRGTDFSGAPVATQRYRELDLNWNWVAPAPGVDPAEFSVRFAGTIAPPEPGEYRFQLERRRCDARSTVERYTIRIEGADPVTVDERCSARDAGSTANTAVVRFHDTKPRPFVVEYAHAHPAPGYAPVLTFVWQAPTGALQRESLRTARDADVIVAFVGLSAWLEGEEMPVKVPGFEGGDRTDIALPRTQAELVEALRATGKPVIVVLQSGSAVALGPANSANAVVAAWYPGEQGGRAIADVLTGAYNPAGRLPVTFYRSSGQLPEFTDYSMKQRTYRYFTGEPEYAFGHGLGFSAFSYSRPRVARTEVRAGGEQIVSVRVSNRGKRAGDEVVQLHVSAPSGGGTPLRSLKGFERIHLAPGESRTVEFRLSPLDMAVAESDGSFRVREGEYRLWIGGGQAGTGAPGAAASFRVGSSVALPRRWSDKYRNF
ncbi:MAG TPA: glycoside hydrolase family 3 C-terminal domain-containing protein [Sphingomicrobium sp.]|nr:glycoside hydrolase family 3 C-terminal domain-containing protein [Sphingomicrobium sp.]